MAGRRYWCETEGLIEEAVGLTWRQERRMRRDRPCTVLGGEEGGGSGGGSEAGEM